MRLEPVTLLLYISHGTRHFFVERVGPQIQSVREQNFEGDAANNKRLDRLDAKEAT